MPTFAAPHFFQLSHFAHAGIFRPENEVWEAINLISSYLQRQTSHKIEIEIPKGVILINPESISIGSGTEIEPGAYIKGPCIIGNGCKIRHGAYIRGNLITGNNCVIGHATEVKNSIMFDDAKAPHFAYVGDSILGNKVNLGAGVKLANFKLDGGIIVIHHERKHFATGLRKLGAIIGDQTQLGCNAVTNPGTLIAPNSILLPCTHFGGVVLKESVISQETRAQVHPKTRK